MCCRVGRVFETIGTIGSESFRSVPLRARSLQLDSDPDRAVLSFISTTTVFGTPVDVTVAELALECLFPANAETAE